MLDPLSIDSIFRDIATRHKDVKSYLNGLESDHDPANKELYPSVMTIPVNVTSTVRMGAFSNAFQIVLQVADRLPQHRSPDDIIRTLNKCFHITVEVLLELACNFLEAEKDIVLTVTNRDGEKIKIDKFFDSDIAEGITLSPFVDDRETNITGFEVVLTINERTKPDWMKSLIDV